MLSGPRSRRSTRRFHAFPAALLLAVALALAACGQGDPIRIGFVGPLTGTFADLGVQGRNGAQLAIEDANDQGGIDGRPLEFLFRDDSMESEGPLAAGRELMDEGVDVIIGPMLSASALESRDLLREFEGVVVSPTVSSPTFRGLEDNFFRVMPTNTDRAQSLAEYAFTEMEALRVHVLGDQDNANYVNTFNVAFINRFVALGGEISATTNYSSHQRRDWDFLVQALRDDPPDALLASASARDVASLAQSLEAHSVSLPIVCPIWPFTHDILLAGGSAVNGVTFATSFSEQNDYPQYLEFKRRYEERFGFPPNFSAAFGYEAATVALTGLASTGGSVQGLAQAMRGPHSYPGIHGPFRLDEFGDVVRPTFIVTIRDGRFTTIRDHDL